ncbi:protein of unknown function [Methylorubrum extorquens]|uniref:Uncharacterized protein n=1 Tax=Methylorubrum extorquens TaxID=408 RepID=A0A2N9AX30_METEX|nr:protein of unknown function [Methylorubrum extorquens]
MRKAPDRPGPPSRPPPPPPFCAWVLAWASIFVAWAAMPQTLVRIAATLLWSALKPSENESGIEHHSLLAVIHLMPVAPLAWSWPNREHASCGVIFFFEFEAEFALATRFLRSISVFWIELQSVPACCGTDWAGAAGAIGAGTLIGAPAEGAGSAGVSIDGSGIPPMLWARAGPASRTRPTRAAAVFVGATILADIRPGPSPRMPRRVYPRSRSAHPA